MQQFQVPQFIEVEDKLFGPLTFKQFLYLAGGIGISFILYAWLPFIAAILPIAGVISISLALAFVKYNGRPFISTLEAFVKYILSSKLYVWKKEEEKTNRASSQPIKPAEVGKELKIPKLSEGKLSELAWSLDVKGDLGKTEE